MVEKVKIIKFLAEKCKDCKECEKACSQIHFKTDEGGDRSAIHIIKEEGQMKMVNCNQNGLCMDVCPVQALKRLPNGVVIVDKKTCIGCMTCVAFCPMDGMRRAEGMVIPHKCISCGACVRACPEGALELVEVNISDIEQKVYIHQGVCQ
jgi:Fe-S-cluster-containing hydrogenase component 2